ncbi:MAG: hypothetical protein LKE39_10595 [Sphaerochaeta sp.]|jgi:hypothetical protein|nr:hypothetical protein [Sphaerochaeta sp.]MCH3920887.1 hypothetical protein [Sphaerochaeta sp.]MCI2045218.1 hypothetical protein [Sphaerochaeta sp.]MCI2076666.1 hypothetical protein [Sphaerochaeta sp.]MCI2096699.1 hypothetical protein [Sphaerochaeta sp.]
MEQYLLPLFCLLCNFATLGACIRFLCAKGGQYWILPLLFTLAMGLSNGMLLFGSASPFSTSILVDALLSVLWYAIVITFHYALKRVIRENNYQERVKKDLAESRWQLKVDARAMEAKEESLKLLANGKPRAFDRGIYPSEWTDYFDQF